MKKLMMFALAMSMVGLLGSGCGTMPSKGRISLASWDSRSAEQIEAYKSEAAQPFGNPVTTEVAKDNSKALPTGWWDSLMNMVSGIRVKLSFVSAEWSTSCPCSECAAKIRPPNK